MLTFFFVAIITTLLVSLCYKIEKYEVKIKIIFPSMTCSKLYVLDIKTTANLSFGSFKYFCAWIIYFQHK